MKILQVVPYFYPAWSYGGPAKLVYDLSKELASLDNKVTVYTSDAFDAHHRMPHSKQLPLTENFTIYYFRNLSNRLAYYNNIYLPFALIQRSLIELRSYDVIHLHDFYTLTNLWIAFLANRWKIPFILSVHGCLEDERMKQRSVVKRIFLYMGGRFLLKTANVLIATSENERIAYKSYGISDHKILELGHGIDVKEFQTTQTRAKCRSFLKVPKSAFLCTYIGRLHSIKGIDLLIQAFSKVHNKHLWLFIAGSDSGYLNTVKQLISQSTGRDRIILQEACYLEEKAQVFKASDVFVYPSRSEGFSLGILEAASTGLPLLITTQCHFSAVEKMGAGFIVSPTITALQQGLEKLLSLSTTQRKMMGIHASKLIEKEYTMANICKRLEKIYLKADTDS